MKRGITLTIDQLGPIKGRQMVEFYPLMVLTGASGLGKSYVAMLLHYFYRILSESDIMRFFDEKNADYDEQKKHITDDEGIILSFTAIEFMEWMNKDAVRYLRRMTGNASLEANIAFSIPDLPDTFSFVYSRQPMMINDETISYMENLKIAGTQNTLKIEQKDGRSGAIPFVILMKNFLKRSCDIDQRLGTFMLPPSRGSLVSLPDHIRSAFPENMGMYKEFLDDLSVLKYMCEVEMGRNQGSADQLLLRDDVLHGQIMVTNNDLVYHTVQKEMPITAAASSIKELAPFALMIQQGALGALSLLFEEPESHLHPELQTKVAQLIGIAVGMGAHMQITSHSDYMIRHLNDLIRLHLLHGKWSDKPEKYAEYCETVGFDPNIHIDPNIVGAYVFEEAAQKGVGIRKQEVDMGIPFDTFDTVIKEQMGRSAQLYDMVEQD